MSHFTVLVIGANYEDQLAPYHEYECTGHNDQYVINIDETPSMLADYEVSTKKMVQIPEGTMLAIPSDGARRVWIHPQLGNLICKYDEVFWQEDLSKGVDFMGRHPTKFVLPEGYVEVEVLKKDLMSFTEFVIEDHGERPVIQEGAAMAYDPSKFETEEDMENDPLKWGYIVQNEAGEIVKVVNRTNPNSHWDWYQVGGRWSGLLKLKPGASGVTGDGGVFGNRAAPGHADSVRKGDIDFDGMRADLEAEAAVRFDKIRALLDQCEGEADYQSWDKIWAQYMPINEKGDYDSTQVPALPGGSDAARAAYHAQRLNLTWREVVQKVSAEAKARGEEPDYNLGFIEFDQYVGVPREQYVTQQGLTAGVTYAVVKDGQWYQRGEMGWWGMSSNEKDKDQWNQEFAALVSGLSDDELLTVVDCHT